MTETPTPQEEAKDVTGVKHLGLRRWVHFGFFVLALLLFWLLERVSTLVWENFAEPNTVVISGASVLTALLSTAVLYKHPTVNRLAYEIAAELAKVTWPSRQEVQTSTVVVIITSLIAAACMGVFDAIWSALTDLVYKV